VTTLLPPIERIPIAPSGTNGTAASRELPTTRRATRRRKARAGVGLALALIVFFAWMLSAFWLSVEVRSPRAPFPAPTASQQWIRSPNPGARAFFRLRVPVYGNLPQTATLWVEGFQQVTAYVDNFDVAPPAVAPNKLVDTQPDIPKLVQTVDIRPALSVGSNVVGLEVVSFDGRPPAFRARVQIDDGGVVRTFGVSPSSWQSTTDVGRTNQVLPQSGAFSKPNLDDGSWVPATASGSRPGTATVTVPPDAYTRPAAAPALVGSYNATNLVASTPIELPQASTVGWIRVAATGPYTVSLDGRAVAFGQPGASGSTMNLSVFDLCPVASGGRHLLTVAVTASRQPMVYLDGLVRDGGNVSTFATGPGWTTGSRLSGGKAASVLNSPETSLGVVFQRTMAKVTVPPGPLFAQHLLLAGEILALVVFALLVLCACGVVLAAAVAGVLCGMLPAVGLWLILTETRHIVYVQPPFPSTPFMLSLVLGALVGGIALVAAFMIWWNARGSARPLGRSAERYLRRTQRPPGWLREHWYQLAVWVTGIGWTLVQSYHIMFNPLWQDELSSLAAAQGIRAHLVPEWPSGFLYWKSELYSGLVAIVGGITHDNPSVLREISVLWLGAAVLLFGLALIPLLLPGRRLYQLAATIVFATAPFELGHAQDIRMYQMVQCLVIVVALFLLKAMVEPTTKRIVLLMASVVAMYLTHEESFGVLFVIPLALLCFQGLRWTKNWRWWAFGGGAVALIGVQLGLAVFTHPPIFGEDPSNGPLIGWSPQPFYYITNFFFTNSTYGASITVVSSLAVLAIVVGLIRRDPIRFYLALFWIVPATVVSLILPNVDTRYVFICLPFVFALAAAGGADVVDGLRYVVMRAGVIGTERIRRAFVELFAGGLLIAVMLSLIGGVNDYGTFTMSLDSANVSQRWLDYPTAVSYVQARIEPGDGVISAATPNLVGYRLGRAPNYWIPPHRTETLLYVFEKNGEAVDTQYGSPTILNATDFENALEGHRRVWLIGPDSVFRSLILPMRSIVETQFKLVEEGSYVSVYLATDS
jgi:hypothetical protein